MAIDTVNGKTQKAATNTAAGSTSETFEVINPADGSAIANVPLDGPVEVAATVARVRANQPAWEELGIKGRAQWLYKLRDWILDHQDEIADTMQAETGKVRGEAAGDSRRERPPQRRRHRSGPPPAPGSRCARAAPGPPSHGREQINSVR